MSLPALHELLPRPPEKPLHALFLALLAWYIREVTFPLREKDVKGQTALVTGGATLWAGNVAF